MFIIKNINPSKCTHYHKMPEEKKKSNSPSSLTTKLYIAIDDLTMALATCDDENVRKSEVFKKALEVIKVVKEMKEAKIKSPEEESAEQSEKSG